jgi:hypothetical protein
VREERLLHVATLEFGTECCVVMGWRWECYGRGEIADLVVDEFGRFVRACAIFR